MLILAFPGMGKTPLSKKSGKYLDLDFGHFREALNVQKDNELSIMPAFSKLVRKYEDDGFVVLSNDPKLMKFAKVNKVFLPANLSDSAKKMGVSKEQVASWVADWKAEAEKYKVPTLEISVGLDHYLLSRKETRKGGERDEERKGNTNRKPSN